MTVKDNLNSINRGNHRIEIRNGGSAGHTAMGQRVARQSGMPRLAEQVGGCPCYAIEKSPLHGLMDGPARRLGAQRVCVNAVSPGHDTAPDRHGVCVIVF